MDISQYDQQLEPFVFLSAEEKIEHLRYCYRTADDFRKCGDFSYTFGYEGDQFCRLLSEYLMEKSYCETDEEVEEISMYVYDATKQHYPHFLGLLNKEEGWENFIRNYVEPDYED